MKLLVFFMAIFLGLINSAMADEAMSVTSNGANNLYPDVISTSEGEKLVFSSNVANTEIYELYTISPNGSNQTQLTFLNGYAGAACFSPDGSRIVFAYGEPDVSHPEKYSWPNVYVIDADGENLQQLTYSDNDWRPDWSHDGTTIIFERNWGNSSLMAINTDGTNVREMTYPDGSVIIGGAFKWSPDDQSIVFEEDDYIVQDPDYPNYPRDIYVYTVKVDGTELSRIIRGGYHPCWSPDGSKIAYVGYYDNDIYVYDIATSFSRRLTDHPARDDYPEWSATGEYLYFQSERAGNWEIYVIDAIFEDPSPQIISINEAATNGFIHGFAYTWEECQYKPISVLDIDESIMPWQGFWIAIPNDTILDGVELLIPKSVDPPACVPILPIERRKHYLISLPLQTDETDLNASSLGQQLGNNRYEKTWRMGRWQWDVERYHNYDGPDPAFNDLMALRPGKGFWFQHINNHPVNIDLDGTKVDPPDGNYVISLPKNLLDVSYTYHMIGNPYWYPIIWSDCMVRVAIPEGSPVGKPVTSADEIDAWNIDLKLEAVDGSVRDTYNRVGIVEKGNAELLQAFDLEPPGEYIRLSMIDPDRITERYTYDYRQAGEKKYIWSIELSTSFMTKDVLFAIDNTDRILDGYSFTLTNDSNGEAVVIDQSLRIPITLSSEAPVTYTLSAITLAATFDPVSVETESTPRSFGITSIIPNPFNPSTTIEFFLNRAENAKLLIYNMNGQLIDTVHNGYLEAGRHLAVWNASGHASGVYIARIETQGKCDVRKMLFMK